MAGYSGTPLPKKLGIKPGADVTLLGAPEGFTRLLDPLPEGAAVKRASRSSDLTILFARSQADLRRRFAPAAANLKERGSIWLAWPKKASGVSTDLAEPFVRTFGLAAGFVDYKVCAIDETWSGLLFTRRR